jgi:inner membrane protein
MRELASWFRESVTGKLFFVGVLVLFLLIPLGMIESQIAERGLRADEAARQIANIWGSHQTIGGPVLILGYESVRPVDDETLRFKDELYTLPSRLTVDIVAETEILRRGIYEIPVYTATVEISGSLPPPPAADENTDVLWDDALLSLPVTDARSIREPVRITIRGTTAEFASGGERVSGLGSQLVVPLSELGIQRFDETLDFTLSFRIGGTAKLMFLPFGDVTTVNLRADWPSPSFGGHFLPGSRNVSDSGFDASWSVLSLGRGYPSSWYRSDPLLPMLAQRISASTFGADLIVPIGVHQASLRATKYAVLFLSLTFLAYFLFELFTPLRLHALQYLFVGLANSIFYLLLIAIAEHVGFVIAYVTSAVASTGLIGGYSAAVLGSARRAVPITLLLGSIYGYLYFILQLEDYALVSGSLGLLAILGGVMYATRHVDWYEMSLASVRSKQGDS